jgi:alpha-tubulin suppressor-like RCC1 family protein
VTSTGGVQCWGYNAYGQLGNGTSVSSSTPVDVAGLTSGVVAIAAGDRVTCALTSGGGVKCWGLLGLGGLGDGTATGSSTPKSVVGLESGVTAITAGGSHACALTTDGAAKCWGLNASAQLGDGTQSARTTPVTVSGLGSGVVAIEAGSINTCAVTSSGGASCWGTNYTGALGDGTTARRLTPVGVSGLSSGVIAVQAAGVNTCALTTGGVAMCWGRNDSGVLGDGTTTARFTPVNVFLSGGLQAISTGGLHTCAVTETGGVKCWGDSSRGELGDGTGLAASSLPVDVYGFTLG